MMKVRHKTTKYTGWSSQFNTHGIGEIIVGFDVMPDGSGDMDSMYLHDFDVLLPDGTWKDLAQAFRDKDVVPDNYDIRFGPPTSPTNRERGYND